MRVVAFSTFSYAVFKILPSLLLSLSLFSSSRASSRPDVLGDFVMAAYLLGVSAGLSAAGFCLATAWSASWRRLSTKRAVIVGGVLGLVSPVASLLVAVVTVPLVLPLLRSGHWLGLPLHYGLGGVMLGGVALLIAKIWPGVPKLALLIAVAAPSVAFAQSGAGGLSPSTMPVFRLDAGWLKPLPRGAKLGRISGLDVDAHQHVWVVQQGTDLPPVLEFDAAGNLIGQWGSPAAGIDWAQSPGALRVDPRDRVWIATHDGRVLKFSKTGALQLQIGRAADSGGTDGQARLTHPVALAVDSQTDELYVLDGGTSQRVVVFNATSGRFAREWRVSPVVMSRAAVLASRGLARPLPPFEDLSAIALSGDGRVYVGDRKSGCVYLFKRDGTGESYAYFAKDGTPARYPWDFAFSRDPQERFLFVADGSTNQLLVVNHTTIRLDIIGTIGADTPVGTVGNVSRVAVDPRHNVYAIVGGELRRWVQDLSGRRPE